MNLASIIPEPATICPHCNQHMIINVDGHRIAAGQSEIPIHFTNRNRRRLFVGGAICTAIVLSGVIALVIYGFAFQCKI